jgi:hypothetical protein
MNNINDQEYAAVIALAGPARYRYFIGKVVDVEELWTLRTDEGFVLIAAKEQELVPVWPHHRFAKVCAKSEWAGAEPAAISLDRWLETWTPGLKKDNRGVAVFPVPAGQGVVVTPDRLLDDLSAECGRYE